MKDVKESSLSNALIFLGATLKRPQEVGAIAPSSKYLGYAISKYIENKDNPIKVIEVGPGTGAFTKIIADKLKPQDQLDVVEYNPEFVKLLKKKFDSYNNVDIQCTSITDWKPDYGYDFMVSSLPFNAFNADFVKLILEHYESIMNPGGIISYFEYMLIPTLKKAIIPPDQKSDFIKLHGFLKDFRNKYEFHTDKVFKNLPPAKVYSLKINNDKRR